MNSMSSQRESKCDLTRSSTILQALTQTSMPVHRRPRFCAAWMVVPHPQKRIEHPVTLIGGRPNDALEEGQRFLGGVADAFTSRWEFIGP